MSEKLHEAILGCGGVGAAALIGCRGCELTASRGALGVETPASIRKADFTSGATVKRASIAPADKAGAKCPTPLTTNTSRKHSSADVGINSDI